MRYFLPLLMLIQFSQALAGTLPVDKPKDFESITGAFKLEKGPENCPPRLVASARWNSARNVSKLLAPTVFELYDPLNAAPTYRSFQARNPGESVPVGEGTSFSGVHTRIYTLAFHVASLHAQGLNALVATQYLYRNETLVRQVEETWKQTGAESFVYELKYLVKDGSTAIYDRPNDMACEYRRIGRLTLDN